MNGDRNAGVTILVTGATGTVGGAVCEELAAGEGSSGRAGGSDPTVRAATRSPGAFDGPADEVVRFDFTDPTTWRAAFADVDALFLVRPPAVSRVRRDLVPALSAAVGAGVERVVFLSVIGADGNPIVPHARIESWLANAGVDATFLRASFFMQNLLTEHRTEIQDGELFVPAGSGKTSFVDARDVAAVGVTALREGTGRDVRAYDLTGPAALGYTEVAKLLTRELGREVQYVDPSVIRFLWRRIRAGEGFGKVAVMAGIYTTARLGLADRVTDDVRRVLGREPRGLSAFVREHRDVWG